MDKKSDANVNDSSPSAVVNVCLISFSYPMIPQLTTHSINADELSVKLENSIFYDLMKATNENENENSVDFFNVVLLCCIFSSWRNKSSSNSEATTVEKESENIFALLEINFT